MLASPTTRPQTEDEKRKKRDRDLLLLLLFLSGSLDTYARQFISGTITRETFLFYAMAVIRQSHWQAASLGVASAGAYTFNPYSVAQRAAEAQTSFVDAFARDLANGRYDAKSDGGEGAAARKRRFGLYGLRLTGTANAAMLAVAQSLDLMVLWGLGANEDHCPDCPRLAARGWMPARSLHKCPGDGQTICVVCCNCRLLFSNGMVSFSNTF